MKTKLSALAFLIVTSSTFAHVNTLPHTHNGSETNWLPGLLSVAALSTVGLLAWKLLKARSTKQK